MRPGQLCERLTFTSDYQRVVRQRVSALQAFAHSLPTLSDAAPVVCTNPACLEHGGPESAVFRLFQLIAAGDEVFLQRIQERLYNETARCRALNIACCHFENMDGGDLATLGALGPACTANHWASTPFDYQYCPLIASYLNSKGTRDSLVPTVPLGHSFSSPEGDDSGNVTFSPMSLLASAHVYILNGDDRANEGCGAALATPPSLADLCFFDTCAKTLSDLFNARALALQNRTGENCSTRHVFDARLRTQVLAFLRKFLNTSLGHATALNLGLEAADDPNGAETTIVLTEKPTADWQREQAAAKTANDLLRVLLQAQETIPRALLTGDVSFSCWRKVKADNKMYKQLSVGAIPVPQYHYDLATKEVTLQTLTVRADSLCVMNPYALVDVLPTPRPNGQAAAITEAILKHKTARGVKRVLPLRVTSIAGLEDFSNEQGELYLIDTELKCFPDPKPSENNLLHRKLFFVTLMSSRATTRRVLHCVVSAPAGAGGGHRVYLTRGDEGVEFSKSARVYVVTFGECRHKSPSILLNDPLTLLGKAQKATRKAAAPPAKRRNRRAAQASEAEEADREDEAVDIDSGLYNTVPQKEDFSSDNTFAYTLFNSPLLLLLFDGRSVWGRKVYSERMVEVMDKRLVHGALEVHKKLSGKAFAEEKDEHSFHVYCKNWHKEFKEFADDTCNDINLAEEFHTRLSAKCVDRQLCTIAGNWQSVLRTSAANEKWLHTKKGSLKLVSQQLFETLQRHVDENVAFERRFTHDVRSEKEAAVRTQVLLFMNLLDTFALSLNARAGGVGQNAKKLRAPPEAALQMLTASVPDYVADPGDLGRLPAPVPDVGRSSAARRKPAVARAAPGADVSPFTEHAQLFPQAEASDEEEEAEGTSSEVWSRDAARCFLLKKCLSICANVHSGPRWGPYTEDEGAEERLTSAPRRPKGGLDATRGSAGRAPGRAAAALRAPKRKGPPEVTPVPANDFAAFEDIASSEDEDEDASEDDLFDEDEDEEEEEDDEDDEEDDDEEGEDEEEEDGDDEERPPAPTDDRGKKRGRGAGGPTPRAVKAAKVATAPREPAPSLFDGGAETSPEEAVAEAVAEAVVEAVAEGAATAPKKAAPTRAGAAPKKAAPTGTAAAPKKAAPKKAATAPKKAAPKKAAPKKTAAAPKKAPPKKAAKGTPE